MTKNKKTLGSLDARKLGGLKQKIAFLHYSLLAFQPKNKEII
jgi:hypothetical protein